MTTIKVGVREFRELSKNQTLPLPLPSPARLSVSTLLRAASI
jgi:hypothetical protein